MPLFYSLAYPLLPLPFYCLETKLSTLSALIFIFSVVSARNSSLLVILEQTERIVHKNITAYKVLSCDLCQHIVAFVLHNKGLVSVKR